MVRSGFVSNSSSSSFIIYSDIDLRNRDIYDEVTNHDHDLYVDIYKQIINPVFDGSIILEGVEIDFQDLSDELRKSIRFEVENLLACRMLRRHAYKVFDWGAQGFPDGLKGLFTDKHIAVEFIGFESDPEEYLEIKNPR